MDMAFTVCFHQSSQQSCEAGTVNQPHSDIRTLMQSTLSDLLMVTQIISDQIMNQDKQREEWEPTWEP